MTGLIPVFHCRHWPDCGCSDDHAADCLGARQKPAAIPPVAADTATGSVPPVATSPAGVSSAPAGVFVQRETWGCLDYGGRLMPVAFWDQQGAKKDVRSRWPNDRGLSRAVPVTLTFTEGPQLFPAGVFVTGLPDKMTATDAFTMAEKLNEMAEEFDVMNLRNCGITARLAATIIAAVARALAKDGRI